MTEKEKMQRQQLYDANYDPLLLAERARAFRSCRALRSAAML